MKLKFFAIAAMLFASVSSFAQEATATNASQTDSKGLAPETELMIMANNLINYGYQTQTALPLIQALEIYNRLGLQEQNLEKTTSGSSVLPEQTAKGSSVSYNRDQIIADATNFADGNKETLALLNGVKGSRNKVGPTIYHTDRVNAHTTDIYTYRFRGGEDAMVLVSGDGDTDLDLYVYDENGNLIASDTDRTDQCVVTFHPRWTGPFSIRIKNLGNVYNRYTLGIPGDY